MILQRFMQQDNNIVKICVVNQDEEVLGRDDVVYWYLIQ
jgi:hypothetical protein